MDETTVEMSADNLAELDMYVAELQSSTSTENQPNGSAELESEVDTSEAFDALVETGLVVVEQAVSILKDIDFAFDERAKQSVVNAARPVAKQYGGALLEQCGDYMNVMTLALAILGLWWASKKQITVLELQKEEEEKRVASRKSD
ncbi:hypothetical protein ACTNIH_004452 [Vibrio parahaemolyticus]|uniref:hypothetical protein n=1 Tax=Vibrio harveyi group TaxID=717610 RepID=UPI0005B8454D|nr:MULTISPECIES: hypothetical protein [Vibrio harveyi group]EGQ8484477.1 hypothetical protein [Vibrio parahaemolyticus]EGQ9704940.1 hypothetical protein [Vibrio parahaemolyticus]EGR1688746.1 hypothetical protein [Vibrio parahaemolyticus]EGR1756789.1 hypothetical protein [Vibrio parahaemolyticus]EGR3177703.1 hypothetical protein [Vibrio parahaemolyticus]